MHTSKKLTIDHLLQTILNYCKARLGKKVEVAFYGNDINLLCKRGSRHTLKIHFQTKKILENLKSFPGPCFQPVELKMVVKLIKKNFRYHFTRICL